MFNRVVTLGFLATSAMASEFFSPAHQFGAMLPRDGLAKRQGYYPSNSICGLGETCAEACGVGSETCPSTSGNDCYDPTIGDTCCPDGTGNSCDAGYYCTSDGEGTTYCCPDGATLSDCAASYSLTVSLIRETGTVAPPSSEATDAPATTTPIHVSIPPFPTATYQTPILPTGNATYTSSPPSEFTGAAAKFAGAGIAVLGGAVAVAGLL